MLAGILKRLAEVTGRKFDAGDFWSRFRIQKAVYLLQASGYPSRSQYRFNLYLRGPYSPDLAKDYYDIDGWAPDARGLVPSADIPDKNLSIVRDAIGKGEYFLEALVTLHSVIETEGKDREGAFEVARRLKPEREAYFEQAWDFLVERRLI